MNLKKPWVHAYSHLEKHELCPKKCYHESVAKDIPFKETEVTIWGNEAHKALQISVSEGRPLGERFTMYQRVVDVLRAKGGTRHCEKMLGITKDLQPCGFFDQNVYARGKGDVIIDLGETAFYGDYKTGKKKSGGRDLDFMAVLIFVNFPHIQKLNSAFIWLSTTPVSLTTKTFTREQLPELWDSFKDDIANFEWSLENNQWNARENFLCKNWCQVFNCIFNGRRS